MTSERELRHSGPLFSLTLNSIVGFFSILFIVSKCLKLN